MRTVFLGFGIFAYFFFFATFLYLMGFVGGFALLPKTIDSGGAVAGTVGAVLIDLTLIAMFGLQHSVMARPGFKARWTKIVPAALERTVYVIAASVMLCVLFVLWQPIPQTLWAVTNPIAADILWAVFAIGWAVVLISTFLISHFQLFGLSQVYANWRGHEVPDKPFGTPLFYRHVRHPLYLGFLLAFWAIPAMSIGHALFAAAMTGYVLIAIGHEERDLVAIFGERYSGYQKRVGMLLPRLR